MNRNGFLGPIGDDLPSLIPLSFALVMFFVSFTYAYNQYSLKSAEFSDDLEAVKIASVLRSNNYISSAGQWSKLCDSVRLATNRLKFEAGITGPGNRVNQAFSLGKSDFFGDFHCENIDSSNESESIFSNSELLQEKKVLVKYYPIALELGSGAVKPKQLVVVVWRP